MPRLGGASFVLLASGLMLTGCLVDSEDRCGENQTFAGIYCVCEEGTIPLADGSGCQKCGEHETPSNGMCVCEPGYVRASADSACTEQTEGLGTRCDPEASTCTGEYPLCGGPKGKDPICTASCTGNADCSGGLVCSPMGDDRVCAFPPTGIGAPCSKHDDCAAFDASFCSPLGACIIADCGASGDARCPGDSVCCDYTMYGAGTLCVEQSALEMGACPYGAPEVEATP